MYIALITFCVIYALLYLIFAFKTKRPIKCLFFVAFTGIAALAVLHIFGEYCGFVLPINIYSITLSASMGLPGVLIALILPFIMV